MLCVCQLSILHTGGPQSTLFLGGKKHRIHQNPHSPGIKEYFFVIVN